MRRWLIFTAVLALIAVTAAAVYAWHRHESTVERAVHTRLDERHIAVSWVSCTNDHSVGSRTSMITYYRCDPHARDHAMVCVPFVGDRLATEAELRDLTLNQVFCEGFG
jgi:hypothetical protein